VQKKILPIIMCGGAGTRLWPRSRESQPKQFLPFIEDVSLLEATIHRLQDKPADIEILAPALICGAGQEATASAQLARTGHADSDIIIEPFGRNTAAVAAVGSLYAAEKDPDALVLLLPADHYVEDSAGFWQGIASGLSAANDGYLVTLGIEPTHPETGYGYIHKGEALGDSVYKVENFKEKPDASTAQSYLDAGDYFWNAGVFLFQPDAMKQAFELHAPDIWMTSEAALTAATPSGGGIMLDATSFTSCPSEAVDVAIMEKTDRVAVVAPVRAGWSDVGSWSVISDIKSEASDSASGAISGDVIAIDCDGSLIETDGPTIAAIGLKDMVIIADGGSILIMPKERAQDVKAIVAQLKADGRTDKR